ncbi:MAG: efflux RND transporter periplasmic adaptor subunit [Pseudomonadota bacterium]
MTRRLRLGWAVAVLALGGVAAAVALRMSGREDKSPEAGKPALEFVAADLVTPAPRPVVGELSMPGTVQALSQATVRAKVAAEVNAVHVREGDRVRAGQRLVEFDTAALRAQLAERVAALESARANLAQAQRTRQVNAQLVERNFISQSAFDNADAAYRAQVASVEVEQAQLAQVQLMLDDTVVRAPISGHVLRRHVQPGEKAGIDAPLLAIVDLSRLEVQAQAAVSDIARVVPGAPAQVAVEGIDQRRFEGRIERVNPGTEPGTRSIHFFVSLPDQGTLLRAGMFATVFVPVGAREAVPSLPIPAIRSEGGQAFVWVLEEGRLRQRPVTLGRRDERAQLVQVAGGLAASDRVLASRFDGLRDGQPALVVQGTAGGPARAASGAGPGASRAGAAAGH